MAGAMKIAIANGCFDLFHEGHRHLLKQAKKGHDWLIVAVNTDESVRELKGDGRPVHTLALRMAQVAQHPDVDAVIPFAGNMEGLVASIRPYAVVKGSDHDPATLHGADLVRSWGGRVVIVQRVGNHSTTDQIRRRQVRRLT